jgi:hypothetical protein
MTHYHFIISGPTGKAHSEMPQAAAVRNFERDA